MLYTDFLKDLKTCPFCSDEHRSVFENESAFLTYSLAPYHKHHMLVIPRRHTVSFLELSQKETADIWLLIEKGSFILERLGYDNYSVLVRNGQGGDKSVGHAHFHVVPKVRLGDLDHVGESRKIMEPEEVQAVFDELKSAGTHG